MIYHLTSLWTYLQRGGMPMRTGIPLSSMCSGYESSTDHTALSVRWRRTTGWRYGAWKSWNGISGRGSVLSTLSPATQAGRMTWILHSGTEQRSASLLQNVTQIRRLPMTDMWKMTTPRKKPGLSVRRKNGRDKKCGSVHSCKRCIIIMAAE